MEMHHKRIQGKDIVFYLAYGLFIVLAIMKSSFYYQYFKGSFLKTILLVCALLLIVDQLSATFFRVKELVGLLFALIAFGLVYMGVTSAADNMLAISIAFIYCARRRSLDEILRFTLIVSCITVGFIVLSSLIGIIPNYLSIKADRARYYLGFLYALYPSTYMLNITMSMAYIRRKTIGLIEFTGFGLINYLMYYMTNSRMTFAMSLGIMIIFITIKIWPDIFKSKILKFILGSSSIICAGLSLWFIVVYSNKIAWMSRLDSALANRLSLAQNSIIKYGISLFPRELSWVGNGLNAYGQLSIKPYDYVDNMYIQILQHFGIIFFVLVIVIMTLTQMKCLKKNNVHLSIIFAMIAVHSLIDDLSMYLEYNTFLMAIGIVTVGAVRNYLPLDNYSNKQMEYCNNI